MAEISKINVGGSVYDIKDATARQLVTNTLHFRGVSTTAVTNGGTQVPTNIYGQNATVDNIAVGDMIIYGKGEYIWAKSDGNGAVSDTGHWILIDSMNVYGALASKSEASGTTESNGAHTHTVTAVKSVSGKNTTSSGSFTPAGTVSTTIAASTAAAQSITLNGGSTGKLQTATYAPSTSDISVIDSVGSVPSLNKIDKKAVTSISNVNMFTANVSSEVLTLTATNPTIATDTVTQITSWAEGSAPTKKTQAVVTNPGSITYATGKTTADGKTFGTAVAISLHSGATAKSSSVTFGTISSTFTGTQGTVNVSGTPQLTVDSGSITTSSAGAHTHTVTVK